MKTKHALPIALIALAVCTFAALALWTRSYLCADVLRCEQDGRTRTLSSNRGTFHYQDSSYPIVGTETFSTEVWIESMPAVVSPYLAQIHGRRPTWLDEWGGCLRFARADANNLVVRFPHGLLTLALLIPTAMLWRKWRAGHRRILTQCVTCAYDLTGNTSGVCSECGQPVEKIG